MRSFGQTYTEAGLTPEERRRKLERASKRERERRGEAPMLPGARDDAHTRPTQGSRGVTHRRLSGWRGCQGQMVTCNPDKAPRRGMQRRKRMGRETREPDGWAVGESVARQTDKEPPEREGRTHRQNHPDRSLHSERHSQRHSDPHNTWRHSQEGPSLRYTDRHPAYTQHCTQTGDRHTHTQTHRQTAAAQQNTHRDQQTLPFTQAETIRNPGQDTQTVG